MFSTRLVRGVSVVQRSLWHHSSRSGRGSSTCPAKAAPTAGGSAASLGSWASVTAVRGTAAVIAHRVEFNRKATPPSSGKSALLLHRGRQFSAGRGSGTGAPGTRRRGDAAADADEPKDGGEKSGYEFLPKEDLGKLSSQSKTQHAMKPEAAEGAAAATEKEGQPEPGNVTLWQRWKNARAKMKLLWKQYGLVWIGTYTVLYFGGLAGIYIVLDTGLVASDVDTSAAIQVLADQLGAQDNANVKWLQSTIKTNPKANTLLKAVIVNELLEYPRDIVAIAATPSIARAIGRAPPKVKS